MKIKITISLSALLIFLLSSPTLACWGYRPMGMGGVFVAVADDANLAYWNRAGAGQLDDWRDGESQIAVTDLVVDQTAFFNRTERAGNTYYDSLNFAQKINNNFGWSIASVWNGGASYAISPSIGFRLPGGGVLDKMSLGIGYYLWKIETYNPNVVINNQRYAKWDILIQQIHLDYLWKVMPEFNFGIHIERFWQLSATETSPDFPNYSNTTYGKVAESMNFRPGIAWLPQGALKGLIVNAGIYDLLAQGGGPHFSAGLEYTPQLGMKKVVSETGKVKYFQQKDSFLYHSHFRAGLYNLFGKDNPYSLFTLGYGYNINEKLEIGYWGGFGFAGAAGAYSHNFGLSWNF